jgi:acetyl esterase/lipase
MKYNLNKELSKMGKKKAPSKIYLYPLVNVFFQMYSCKSDDDVLATDHYMYGYNGARLKTILIEPKHAEKELPCIIYYHGGGFLLRASKTHYQIAKWYASKARCKVVFADYRLLPKYKFPVAIEDCFETYKWVLNNADALGISKNKILLAGDSAGANISVAVTLMSKDRNVPCPKGNLLIYPVLDRRMNTASMEKYTDTPVWDSRRNKMFWKAYLKEYTNEQIKYASPMEAESLAGFPNTYIEVAEFDCLHDEGIEFTNRLENENVDVVLYEVEGACHGFEDVLNSDLLHKCIDRRVRWIKEQFS